MAQKVRDQGEEVEQFGYNVDEAEVNIEHGAQHLSIAESLMVLNIIISLNNYLYSSFGF